MSIVVRFHPANLTPERYEEVVQKLDESGDSAPDGRDYHVCFTTDEGLVVSEIWDSPEKMEAYRDTLMPVLSEAGIELGAQPDVFEVHNIVKR